MKKIIAVATIDGRRLGFGLVSAALLAGLVPSLASGLGGRAPAESVLAAAFALIGIAAGAQFGNDFKEGRSSFFFARPLPTGALIAGRLASTLVMAAASYAAFTLSYWISSRKQNDFHLSLLTMTHARALAISFALALYFGLAIAVHAPAERSTGRVRALLMSLLRLLASLGGFILIFGLFADLSVRAYFHTRTPPFLVFAGSWIAATFLSSCVAIVAGRTERLRIRQAQNRVMAGFMALAIIVIGASWVYVLHPGPGSIEGVTWGSVASPDGRSAYVPTSVNRGDSLTFKPVFVLDVASGQARRLNSDPYFGPWISPDGGTLVWSEATPFFFRPLWRLLGGATSFRVRTSGGSIEVLPLPGDVPDGFNGAQISLGFGAVDQVLPSSDGDLFAILWDKHLAFTSRSKGELSHVDLGPGQPRIVSAFFLPSGTLRAARIKRVGGEDLLDFVDIDPASGSLSVIFSMSVGPAARTYFETGGARAFVFSGAGTRQSVFLVIIGAASPRLIPLVRDGITPSAVFLADGRIAATANDWEKERKLFRVFSPSGDTVSDIARGEGMNTDVRGEIFPGLLAASSVKLGQIELDLVDATTGAFIRALPGAESILNPWLLNFRTAPPPGSPSARLVQTREGKLYELPSPSAELRLLLPLSAR